MTTDSPKIVGNSIPTRFLEWLVSSRVLFLDNMLKEKSLKYFSAHLPVMVTWRRKNFKAGDKHSTETSPHSESGGLEELFPVNMTVKGIGLIPKEEYLQKYTELYERATEKTGNTPWEKTLSKRIDAVKKLYGDIEKFDPLLLGGLEIFEGRAYENLKANPYASFLYVGMLNQPGCLSRTGLSCTESRESQGPSAHANTKKNRIQYISFQVNGKVEILKKGNPYYNFLLASRKLFEFDKFHLYQPDYPFGYLIKVMEVRDKSPWTRNKKG